jgi:hypothetical protein
VQGNGYGRVWLDVAFHAALSGITLTNTIMMRHSRLNYDGGLCETECTGLNTQPSSWMPIFDLNSKSLVAFLCWLFCSFCMNSQYANVTLEQGIYFSGTMQRDTGLSTYDFNHDGLDDITLGSANDGVYVYQNNGNGFAQIFLFDFIPGIISTVQWVDIDNDLDEDFFATRDGMTPVLLRHDEGDVFVDISDVIICPHQYPRSLCAAWADYDNDGFLDLYVANFYFPIDNISNWLFRNNGDGTFTECASMAGVDNGSKLSWQPTWIDWDMDGDQDLYVLNERSHGCSFYSNNGDGTFSDVVDQIGANILEDPMGVSWADYDHDGDFDFYVTNSTEGNQMMGNNSGVFQNMADSLDMAVHGFFSWGVQFTDTQNDSYEDLFITTSFAEDQSHDFLFIQDTLNLFSEVVSEELPTGTSKGYGLAELDFDNNGFMDLVAKTVMPVDVYLLENVTDVASNNWIKIGLQGTVSNANAVGSVVQVFANGQCQMQVWQCGEGYCTQNSQYEIFGLGNAVLVDSIQIVWPGGWIDHFYNINVNSFYQFTEGETISSTDVVQVYSICPGDTATLSTSQNISASWSNDFTGTAISVHQPGIYVASYSDEYGFVFTETFSLSFADAPLHDVSTLAPSCHGSEDAVIFVEMDEQSGLFIEWQNGQTSAVLEEIGAGEYFYSITDQNNCHFLFNVIIADPLPLDVNVLVDTICAGTATSAQFEVFGGSGTYFLNWNNQNPDALTEGEYVLNVSDSFGCEATEEFTVRAYASFEPLVTAPLACFGQAVAIEYAVPGSNGNYFFDFDEHDPLAMMAGLYTVVVFDENFCHVLYEFEVTESAPLAAELQVSAVGDPEQTLVGIEVSGGSPPYSFLWSNGGNEQQIVAQFDGTYGCTVTDALGCTFYDEIGVTIISVTENFQSPVVYPIPCRDELNMTGIESDEVMLFDAAGRLVKHWQCNGKTMRMDLHDFENGKYILRSGSSSYNVVKMD